MSLEGLNLALKIVLLFNKLAINVLEVLDLSLECGDLFLSHLKSDSAVVLKVAQLLATEELLVIHLGKLVLSLHVLMVELLEVLDLGLQFLKGGLSLVELMGLLTDLDMNCG